MSLVYYLQRSTFLGSEYQAIMMVTPYLKSEDHTPAGWKLKAIWECTCTCIAYIPPTARDDRDDRDDFSIQERFVCGEHSRLGFLTYNMPPGRVFSYSCTTCGYYLEEDNHFGCENDSEEYHPEVHATEYFGGFCDGVERCPICGTLIDYDEVYKAWVKYCGEMRAEAAAEDREEPSW
jgi:hypothetical protein